MGSADSVSEATFVARAEAVGPEEHVDGVEVGERASEVRDFGGETAAAAAETVPGDADEGHVGEVVGCPGDDLTPAVIVDIIVIIIFIFIFIFFLLLSADLIWIAISWNIS